MHRYVCKNTTMEYINRILENDVRESLVNFPVVAVLGPRQCGKSTMVKHLVKDMPNSIYLDLERPSDLQKLEDAEWFLSYHKDKLVCLDEIQRRPDLFPVIRSLVDEGQGNGRFLLLGSASRDLLRQSSESLAGRIVYKSLTPLLWEEIKGRYPLEDYLFKGGFPRSIMASSLKVSSEWLESFIGTFLERDLMQWKGASPSAMRRLWQMLAFNNGQTANYSRLADSLSVSSVTVKNYIDLLNDTFMVTVVPPYLSNLGRRLVKSPKVYISDAGITTSLLQMRRYDDLVGSIVLGSVWEQVVVTNLKAHFPNADITFYRSAKGAEVDFVVRLDRNVFAIECKCSTSPSLQMGFYSALEDIRPDRSFVVAPIAEGWPMKPGVDVVSLVELFEAIG